MLTKHAARHVYLILIFSLERSPFPHIMCAPGDPSIYRMAKTVMAESTG